MTPDPLINIFKRIQSGPSIIFLGQDYLIEDHEENPIMKELRVRFPKALNSGGLTDFLPFFSAAGASSILGWLQRKSDNIPIGETLDIISEFPWNHVVTSAIDSAWTRAFKKRWRSVRGIYSDDHWPDEIRDRHLLCATYLFGSVDKEDDETKPPLDEFELDERRQVAITLLKRLPEILTPRGTLLIVGWNPQTDWLKSKELYPIINSLTEGQAFLFPQSQNSRDDSRIAKLCENRKLCILDTKIKDLFISGVDENLISLGDPGLKLAGRQITINGRPCVIPKEIFLGVERCATILDDNLTMPPRHLNEQQEYFAFLRFLESPIQNNNWENFGRNFVFERDFYNLLSLETLAHLRSRKLHNTPIILHGETGTGKTISLGNLAYHIASTEGFPTLFIERTIRDVDWRAVDRFLKWAEDNDAASCLIIWDGMCSQEEYAQVAGRLADRARKVVLIGSSYLISNPAKRGHFIEADRELNDTEKVRFTSFLDRFASDLGKAIREKNMPLDEVFLVSLYRLLPSTRPTLRAGVATEIQQAQEVILERIRKLPSKPAGLNTLATALDMAGLTKTLAEDWQQKHQVAGEAFSDIQKLFALVLTPGRYGCAVPIELLLSSLGKTINETLLSALDTNVLRWDANHPTEIFVEPRHPLEAQLFLERMFGGSAAPEVEFINMLILGLRRPGSAVGTDSSIDFIVDLLRRIGPNSSVPANRLRFKSHTLEFANSLEQLRKTKNVVHPRLILQEASFVREAVTSQRSISETEKKNRLESAINVLSSISNKEYSNSLLSAINEELAACYGTLLHLLTDEKHVQSTDVQHIIDGALNALEKAWTLDSSNVHSTVTLGWISQRILDSKILSKTEEAEIISRLLARFDESEIEGMDYVQREFFLKAHVRVMETLGNMELAEESFKELLSTGSKAGYFLRARKRIEVIPEEIKDEHTAAKVKSAFDYLNSNLTEISNDARCMSLHFRLWWLLRVGRSPFSIERQVLPFTEAEWRTCFLLSQKLLSLESENSRPSLKLINAMAQFHLEPHSPAGELFRQLATDMSFNLGGRRLRKMFVASMNGEPLIFDGHIQEDIKHNQSGKIWIDKFRISAGITPKDFDRMELKKNQHLNDFHITFSFTGPIAQPPFLLKNQK